MSLSPSINCQKLVPLNPPPISSPPYVTEILQTYSLLLPTCTDISPKDPTLQPVYLQISSL